MKFFSGSGEKGIEDSVEIFSPYIICFAPKWQEIKKREVTMRGRNVKGWYVLCVMAVIVLSGCATTSWEVQFKKQYKEDEQLSQRDKPAEKTNMSKAALLENGYVIVGSITVMHDNGKSYESDPTTRAKKEAAKYGGDLIQLEIDNQPAREHVVVGRTCVRKESRLQAAGPPSDPYKKLQPVDVCVSWADEYEEKSVIKTLAFVYRHDPAIYFLEVVKTGNIEKVKLLIAKGADVNAKNINWHITPLMMAAEKGHTEIAMLLIEKGADVNARDKGGRTALKIAKFYHKGDKHAIVKLLIKAGAKE